MKLSAGKCNAVAGWMHWVRMLLCGVKGALEQQDMHEDGGMTMVHGTARERGMSSMLIHIQVDYV